MVQSYNNLEYQTNLKFVHLFLSKEEDYGQMDQGIPKKRLSRHKKKTICEVTNGTKVFL